MTNQNEGAESTRIEQCAREAHYSEGVMAYATAYCGALFKSHMLPGGVLELGPAEGVMTDLLYPDFSDDYTIVDGAEIFVQSLEERYPNMKCYCKLFEEFQPNRKYDNIVLGHVLEHVESPVEILKLCTQWLTPKGRILAAVPNANSIHRQAAVHMGLLSSCHQLNETDRRNGHRRVYNKFTLERDFLGAGIKITASGGYWLKPLSNMQIDNYWTEEMINAFLRLGEAYPDIAGEIYVIAEKEE